MGEDWDTLAQLVELPAVVASSSARLREHLDQRTNRASGGKSVTTTPEAYVAGRVYQVFCEAWARECLRVLKPGGHLAAFGHPRTYHRLVCGVEDAGFEPRDTVLWIFGQGMPKSHNVARELDVLLCTQPGRHYQTSLPADGDRRPDDHLCPATDASAPWQGWGTGLKPAFEPITVARKPLDGTIARNVLAHGTGGLHIDAARINVGQVVPGGGGWRGGATSRHEGWRRTVHVTNTPTAPHAGGRWPANLILSHGPACQLLGVRHLRDHGGSSSATAPSHPNDDAGVATQRHLVPRAGDLPGPDHAEVWACQPGCPVAELDRQSGVSVSHPAPPRVGQPGDGWRTTHTGAEYNDAGGASRFFYIAKARRAERPCVDGVEHPSVKPRDLVRLLLRLVVPAGGLVLDPFAGSGTTLEAAVLEGLASVGCDKTAKYLPLVGHRLRRAHRALRVPWQPDAPPLPPRPPLPPPLPLPPLPPDLAEQATLWDAEVPT